MQEYEREPPNKWDATVPDKVVRSFLMNLFDEEFRTTHEIDSLVKEDNEWKMTFREKEGGSWSAHT